MRPPSYHAIDRKNWMDLAGKTRYFVQFFLSVACLPLGHPSKSCHFSLENTITINYGYLPYNLIYAFSHKPNQLFSYLPVAMRNRLHTC